MRESAKLDDVLPFLKFFRKCRKEPKLDFKLHLRKSLLNELKIKIPKSELELQKEPFLMLGYGINSYFDNLLSLMYLFIILTVVVSPLLYIFSSNEVLGLS